MVFHGARAAVLYLGMAGCTDHLPTYKAYNRKNDINMQNILTVNDAMRMVVGGSLPVGAAVP